MAAPLRLGTPGINRGNPLRQPQAAPPPGNLGRVPNVAARAIPPVGVTGAPIPVAGQRIPLATPGNLGSQPLAARPPAGLPVRPAQENLIPVATPGNRPSYRDVLMRNAAPQKIPVATPGHPIPGAMGPAIVLTPAAAIPVGMANTRANRAQGIGVMPVAVPPIRTINPLRAQPAVRVQRQRRYAAIPRTHHLSCWQRFVNFLRMIFCCKC